MVFIISEQAGASKVHTDPVLHAIKDIISLQMKQAQQKRLSKIAVIGGCEQTGGGAYFAGLSVWNIGAHQSHVFCTNGAAPTLQSYNPKLIVVPKLDSIDCGNSAKDWIKDFDILVFGPGLGRNHQVLENVKKIICHAVDLEKSIIVDADAFRIVNDSPQIISGYKKCILTPNKCEFWRLYESVVNADDDQSPPQKRQRLNVSTEYPTTSQVQALANKLGGVTIVSKGPSDIITNGVSTMVCDRENSMTRCWGQGDVLSGSLGAFYSLLSNTGDSEHNEKYDRLLLAGYAACFLTRECNHAGFRVHGRSLTTSDMVQSIHKIFKQYFSS